MANVNAKIKFEFIEETPESDLWIMDLAESGDYQKMVLGFGNGLFAEARVVGETRAGVFFFVNLIGRGGYKKGHAPSVEAKLYHEGDACFPETHPFIFVSPNTESGEYIDFDNYEKELEEFIKVS